jgi:thiosulfate dehydrogenase
MKMGRFLLGVFLGMALLPVALLGWLWRGAVPVAVADPPFPHEKQLSELPLRSRIGREMVKTPPIQVDEDNLLAGARVYSEKCGVCHGFHGKPSVFGGRMFPVAPPLLEVHPGGTAVGVSDDPAGETFWKVANGIRLTGMPAWKGALTENAMWQVSLLAANADKPLPPAAVNLLRGEAPAEAETKK